MANVVQVTPVDTGRARSNWLVGLGGPRRSEIDPFDKTGAGAIATGNQIVAAFERGNIFISNNVPYIGELDRGSSDQVEAGFVRRGIDDAQRELRRAARVFPDSSRGR